jgi:DeoR/GlpR family transcriptional regulator of sugar metabolism
VIGCSGLTPEGPNDVNPAAAGIKRAMLARAESNMLLLDHSKYDVLALENVCSLDAIRLIVADRPPTGELARAVKRAGIAIEIAS